MAVGIVYGIRTLDPTTLDRIELGYVGKTRQNLRTRETQHREDQPWEDIIVGSAHVIATGLWSDDDLDLTESWAIGLLAPRYNIDKNHNNANRIAPADAIEQRFARDRLRGVPLWMPPKNLSVVRQRSASVTSMVEKQRNDRLGRGMSDGHLRLLELIGEGVSGPGALATATGYSERQIHNLLNELRDNFRVIERAGHGMYVVTTEAASL